MCPLTLCTQPLHVLHSLPLIPPQTTPPEQVEADFQERVAQEHRLDQFQVSRVGACCHGEQGEPVAMVSRGACCQWGAGWMAVAMGMTVLCGLQMEQERWLAQCNFLTEVSVLGGGDGV